MNAYVSSDELHRAQASGLAPTIIDVRDPEEYAAGHLPGAVNIPLADLPDRLATIPRDRPVVTY